MGDFLVAAETFELTFHRVSKVEQRKATAFEDLCP